MTCRSLAGLKTLLKIGISDVRSVADGTSIAGVLDGVLGIAVLLVVVCSAAGSGMSAMVVICL